MEDKKTDMVKNGTHLANTDVDSWKPTPDIQLETAPTLSDEEFDEEAYNETLKRIKARERKERIAPFLECLFCCFASGLAPALGTTLAGMV